MQVLLVVAHPLGDSFTHAVADAAVDGLRAGGHDVDVIDLYAIGYRAAMTLDERVAYDTDQPVIDPVVDDHVQRLRRSQALVVVYPTWWSSMPAILKGWLERTMVPGVAFRLDDRNKVRPALTNITRIVGISTYGSKHAYVSAINDNGRRTFARALRLTTGLRTRVSWLPFYGVDARPAEHREAFLQRVRREMQGLT